MSTRHNGQVAPSPLAALRPGDLVVMLHVVRLDISPLRRELATPGTADDLALVQELVRREMAVAA